MLRVNHCFAEAPLLKTTSSRKFKKDDSLDLKYEARLAEVAMKLAQDSGFLVSPSNSFVLEQHKTSETDNLLVQEFNYIHLTNVHLRTLGCIQSCRYLVICILSNNYLTHFNGLENCRHMKRLDLHCNQIVQLPDENFWIRMKKLLILNLHDNGVGKLDSVESLARCPNLVALTLYGTPLSLITNYRHHVVNTIWSLKALDHFVIADDEIIEDSIFSKHFRTMNRLLFIDLCPKNTESMNNHTLAVDLRIVKKILADINHCLAHGSPVIVVQRWIRGHLCRRKLNISYFEITQKLKRLNLPLPGTYSDAHIGVSCLLDYDAYFKGWRPGSKTSSMATLRPDPSMAAVADSQIEGFGAKLFPPVQINIVKFQERLMHIFQQGVTEQRNTVYRLKKVPGLMPRKSISSRSVKLTHDKTKLVLKLKAPTQEQAAEKKIPQSSKKGFPRNISVALSKCQCKEDPEIPNYEWRIHNKTIEAEVEKPAVAELNPLHEHMVMNKEVGKDLRDAIEHWHDQEKRKPKPTIVKHKPVKKFTDYLSLATLMAVAKAYHKRDGSGKAKSKRTRVIKIQRERLQTKRIVNVFKEDKRNSALNRRAEERARITKAIHQAHVDRAAYVDYARERKEKALLCHHKRHNNLKFMTEFSNEYVSVSNALIRHDRQAAIDSLVNEKTDIANDIKVQQAQQAEFTYKYVEHKKLVNQIEATKEKSRIKSIITADAVKRETESKRRVALLKAKKGENKAFKKASLVGCKEATNASVSSSKVVRRLPLVFPDVLEHNYRRNTSSVAPIPSAGSSIFLPSVTQLPCSNMRSPKILFPLH